MTDAEAMEASLLALEATGIDLRDPLFEYFFDAFPNQHVLFINREAASQRMTDETLQMLFGLANDETWVETSVASFMDNHRNYGVIPTEHHVKFIDMVVDTMAEVVGEDWAPAWDAAWRAQAEKLKPMIAYWADYDWRKQDAA